MRDGLNQPIFRFIPLRLAHAFPSLRCQKSGQYPDKNGAVPAGRATRRSSLKQATRSFVLSN